MVAPLNFGGSFMHFWSFFAGLWAGATIAVLALMFIRGGRGEKPASEGEEVAETQADS